MFFEDYRAREMQIKSGSVQYSVLKMTTYLGKNGNKTNGLVQLRTFGSQI